jgi:hypothetical protein
MSEDGVFWTAGVKSTLKHTSSKVVFLVFSIHTTFQSEIIKKLLNSNLTCDTSISGPGLDTIKKKRKLRNKIKDKNVLFDF